MKILVSGSNGFIGKQLVQELEKKGHEVTGFDRSNGQNILALEQLKTSLKKIDAVYHLAASISETDKRLFETNVQGTKNILEASAKAQVKQFIFLSTTGVMGDTAGIADEKTPFNPKTDYEKSKAAAEELVLAYQEVLPITIVRSAIVMGPNNEWKEIIKMVKKGFPLTGDGKNYWQTVFVKDLAGALVFLLENEMAIGETFIVAEQNPKTLLELVEIIKKELGIPAPTKTIPLWLGMLLSYAALARSKLTGKKTILLPAHMKRLARNRHYSTQKIQKIGWQAKYPTEQAVKETIMELKEKGI